VQELFQNSTNKKDVGERVQEIVRAAAADVFRPLHALGFIVISSVLQAFRSKGILFLYINMSL
jgi:hypothetical protein